MLSDAQKAFRCKVHETISKVSDDVGRRYTFNTAIAANMELLNELGRFKDDSEQGRALVQEALDAAVLMLSPIVPHICQELWQAMGHSDAVVDCRWPVADESAMQKDSIELVVQVNGKMRGRISVAADASNEVITDVALAEPNVKRFMEGKALRKAIVVPGRLVNLVVA